MAEPLRVTVVGNVRFSSCGELLDLVSRCRDDLYLICGGVGECLEVLDAVSRGYGIVSVYDDEHVVKVLKQRNMFLCGRWAKVDGICIAGIDGKNPTQSMSRILSSVPEGCNLFIVVSSYTLAGSTCSRAEVKGRTLHIGLPRPASNRLIDALKGVPLVFIACPDRGAELCIDRLHSNAVLVSVARSVHVIRLEIDPRKPDVVPLGLQERRPCDTLRNPDIA